jgi:hypothetical protein
MEEKYKIHAFYILGILLTIIAILITIKWGDIPNLAQYISFGLTFASLLLAILAIGYAVYSNSSLSQSISTLNIVSHDISATSESISQAATDLAQKIETIPSKLEIVEGRVAETNILIKQFTDKQETLPPSKEEQKAAGEIADTFLDGTSILGLFALFICAVAYTNKAPFKLSEICESLKLTRYDYAFGFLVAVRAAGLVNITDHKYIWNVVGVNERLLNGLRSELVERIKTAKTEGLKTAIETEIGLIEDFFGITVDRFSAAT